MKKKLKMAKLTIIPMSNGPRLSDKEPKKQPMPPK